jgi:hypothetical protein
MFFRPRKDQPIPVHIPKAICLLEAVFTAFVGDDGLFGFAGSSLGFRSFCGFWVFGSFFCGFEFFCLDF